LIIALIVALITRPQSQRIEKNRDPPRMTEEQALLELAAVAARLVVDDGLDYAAAKRRAAREVLPHRASRSELPSSEQVEDAVREHLALFHADTQPAELRALRELALTWMRRLAEFRPHLAGAAWRGTATRRSPILLDLYCDDAKAAEIALINQGVSYEAGGSSDAPVLTLTERSAALADWVVVQLTLHDRDAVRGALKPDARGRSWRGDLGAVERLLQAEAGGGAGGAA
jgi:hypothetical protein